MTLSIQTLILLSLLLVISLIVNAIMVWYARASIVQLAFVSENIADLKNSVSAYSAHLKSVHELEMFYGDETLGALMKHTNELQENLNDYDEFYDLFGAPLADVAEVDVEEILEEANAETQTG